MDFFKYQFNNEIRQDAYIQYAYEEAYKVFEAIEQKNKNKETWIK